MIYNPSPTYPTGQQGLEISSINRFTWQFNSDNGEVQTNYQLKVWTLADVLVYDSTLITSSNQYHDVPSSTFTADVVYKWKVTTDGKTNNQYAIFKAVDAGTVTIDTLPSPFAHQFYVFSATYTQSQGIIPKSYSFNLYNNSDVLLSTSGTIIGATPTFEFTGLLNSTIYKVDCTVTNQLDITKTSAKVSFTTAYVEPYAPDLAFVRADNIAGANVVDWSAVVEQIGSVSGDYSFVTGQWNNALYLNVGSVLTYDLDINLPEVFTSVLFIKLPSGFNGKMFEFYKNGNVEYEIGYIASSQKFYYKRGSRFTSGVPVTLPAGFFRFYIHENYIGYQISGEYFVR